MTKTINILLVFSCLFFLFSCEKDDFENTISDTETEVINEQDDASFQAANFGDPVVVDFIGRIIDVSGNAIADVEIRVGSNTTQTDNNGVFILENVSVFQNFAFLKANKDGYILGSRALIPDQNTINDVQITLLEKNIVTTVQAGESSIATLGESSVSFTGGFIDANNNPYTGEVEVSMHYLQPNQRETFEQMPGMLFAQNLNNEARSLETYGMLTINLFSPSGDMLNIAEGAPATIEFPVDDSQIGIAPETIPLWFFDENVGYWKEQGEAVKVGDKYIGEVTHFTWWNCDVPIDVVEVCLTIQNNNGGVAAVPIQIIRNQTGQVIFEGILNQDGNECGLFPDGEEVTLKVFGADDCADEEIYEAQLGPYMTDTIVVVTIPEEAIAQTTLIGTVTNCNGIPLENGLGVLIDDFGQITGISFSIENGVLDYTFIPCEDTSYNLLVVDVDQNHSTEQLPINIIPGEINIGVLSTCEQQGGVFEGDVTLNSQAEVDVFGSMGYTTINGNFLIGGPQGISLTSIDALETLEEVTGHLSILNIHDLESLDGLHNLHTIGGALSLTAAYDLTSINALQNLTEVNAIGIAQCGSLQSLEGLNNVNAIERLSLTASIAIESLEPLQNIDMHYLNDLLIADMPLITSISLFSQVQEFEGQLFIRGLSSLPTLQGLENITTSNRVDVTGCDSLISLEGLNGLTSPDRLYIDHNDGLQSLDGLENLSTIGGEMSIGSPTPSGGNPQLSDLCALQNIFTNGSYGNVIIENNAYNPTIQDIIDGNCSN